MEFCKDLHFQRKKDLFRNAIEIPPNYFLVNLYIDRTKRKSLGIFSQASGNY